MALLKPATNETAFLKAGIMGFAGTGKTYTASSIAIGLAKMLDDGKPIAFFDTETGSDHVIHRFEAEGLKLVVAKTRAFSDLMEFMREAEAECSVAIIDSISHVWTELLEAYTAKLRRKWGLEFQDWGKIKPEWRQFTDRYLCSKMHVILCGRAGYEYDYENNQSTGKRELVKTGTKMKAETEMGYEPSLLMEMIRLKRSEVVRDPDAKGWIHRAFVNKDRWDLINGQEFDNPSFEDIKPVIDRLNLGGTHHALDAGRSSEDMFDSPDRSVIERRKLVEIALEDVKNELVRNDLDGSKAEVKKQRLELLESSFGTGSWAAISNQRLEEIKAGLARMREILSPKPADAAKVTVEDHDLNEEPTNAE